MAAAVVEIVAERNDHAWRVMRDQPREPRQCLCRVVGRQQSAAPREARAFFQMQVRDDEQAFLGPIERTGAVGRKRDAGYAHAAVARAIKAERAGSGGCLCHCPESIRHPPYASATRQAKPEDISLPGPTARTPRRCGTRCPTPCSFPAGT